MSFKLNMLLESFNNSVLEVTKGSYGGKWPMPFFTSTDVGMVIDNYWGDFFLEIIKKLKENKLSIRDIAKKVSYPSPFSRVFYSNVQLKLKKYPIEKIKAINTFTAELMYPLYKKDIFCKNWSNILWSKKEIKRNYNSKKTIWLKNLKNIKDIIKYNGYLRAITEMLFFYWDNFGHEIHGPYELDSKNILLIREWHDLKPRYFEFSKIIPYDHIRIYEIYKPNTKIKIDISNRVYINSRTDICLLGFYFESPEKILDLSETVALIEEIEKICEEGVKEITSLQTEQIFRNAVYMHFYLFKPLTNILGISWEPTETCMNRVRKGVNEEEKKAFRALICTNLDKRTIKQLFDYRLRLPSTFYE